MLSQTLKSYFDTKLVIIVEILVVLLEMLYQHLQLNLLIIYFQQMVISAWNNYWLLEIGIISINRHEYCKGTEWIQEPTDMLVYASISQTILQKKFNKTNGVSVNVLKLLPSYGFHNLATSSRWRCRMRYCLKQCNFQCCLFFQW